MQPPDRGWNGHQGTAALREHRRVWPRLGATSGVVAAIIIFTLVVGGWEKSVQVDAQAVLNGCPAGRFNFPVQGQCVGCPLGTYVFCDCQTLLLHRLVRPTPSFACMVCLPDSLPV